MHQYTKALQQHAERHWTIRHYNALVSITPENARAYFRNCGVPGCENSETECDEECDEETIVVLAAVAVVVAAVAVHIRRKRRRTDA